MFGWGWNEFGQCGSDPSQGVIERPKRLIDLPKKLNVSGAAASGLVSYIVDKSGVVYAFGKVNRACSRTFGFALYLTLRLFVRKKPSAWVKDSAKRIRSLHGCFVR